MKEREFGAGHASGYQAPSRFRFSGFGGRVYFPTGKGFITMQVMPKPPPSDK